MGQLDIEIKKLADKHLHEYDEIEYGSSDEFDLRKLVRRYCADYIRAHRIGRLDDSDFLGGLEETIEAEFQQEGKNEGKEGN